MDLRRGKFIAKSLCFLFPLWDAVEKWRGSFLPAVLRLLLVAGGGGGGGEWREGLGEGEAWCLLKRGWALRDPASAHTGPVRLCPGQL